MLRILPMPIAQYKIDGKDLFTSIQMQDYAIDCQEAAKEENKFFPPKREWVGLTDEEVDEWTPEIHAVVRSVEAKLKEKNGG